MCVFDIVVYIWIIGNKRVNVNLRKVFVGDASDYRDGSVD